MEFNAASLIFSFPELMLQLPSEKMAIVATNRIFKNFFIPYFNLICFSTR
jgi:hypothetical protein